MPVFEQYFSVVGRGVRAFLKLEVGITRSKVRAPRSRMGYNRKLQEARRQLAGKQRELAELRARLSKSGTSTEAGNIKPENIVWIFGTGRSGNTWLSTMMKGAGHTVWHEPAIGKLFGEFYYRSHSRESPKFVLGDAHKNLWLNSIKHFVLEGARGRFSELSERDYLVIRDQLGSIGAPLLMEALPESRMVLLVRDPRDVVASWLDGTRTNGWHHERVAKSTQSLANENPDAFVKREARHYLEWVGKAKEAYDAHRGHKVLVRYEELRADTLETMRRIHSTLGISVDEERLERAVQRRSWENISKEEKGEGKFYRKATPGSWREDLTPEQARAVEEITRPLLEEFYA